MVKDDSEYEEMERKKKGVWVYNCKNSMAGFTLIFSTRKMWPPYISVHILALVLKIHPLIQIAVSSWLQNQIFALLALWIGRTASIEYK